MLTYRCWLLCHSVQRCGIHEVIAGGSASCFALLRLTKADLLNDAAASDGLADALLGALQAAKLLSATGIVELAIDDAHILAAPVASAFGAELAAKATQIVHVVKRAR